MRGRVVWDRVFETLLSHFYNVVVLVLLKSNCGIEDLNVDLVHEQTCLVVGEVSSTVCEVGWDALPVQDSRNISVTISSNKIESRKLWVDSQCLNSRRWLAQGLEVSCGCFDEALHGLIDSKEDGLVVGWVNSKQGAWALPSRFVRPGPKLEPIVRSLNRGSLLFA